MSRVSRWECSVYTKRRCRMMLFLHCHCPACPSSPSPQSLSCNVGVFSLHLTMILLHILLSLLRLVNIHYGILVTYSTPPLEAPLSYCWYGRIPCSKLVLRVLCRHPAYVSMQDDVLLFEFSQTLEGPTTILVILVDILNLQGDGQSIK